MALVIAISKGSGSPKYGNYAAWLERSGEELELIDMVQSADPDGDMARADALVLTGGSDVDPARYGRPDLEPLCEDIDRERDALEFRLLELANERQIPVLAICRGMQVMNVHHGGTLIAHLPAVVPGAEMHAKDGPNDRMHEIEVTPGTLLFKAAGDTSGVVNTAHHQAVDRLGEGLVVTARSADGVVEAFERLDHNGKPYMMAVQWHPERMPDQTSRFSIGIREQFLFEAHSAQILVRTTKPLPKPEPPPPTENRDDDETPPNGLILPVIQ